MENSILDEQKIKMYCKKYGYSYNYFGYNTIIETGMDVWKLEDVEVFNKENKEYNSIIKVKHYNKKGNSKGKMQFHPQRYARDIDYIFNNIIIPHELKRGAYQKAFKIKKLLQNV